MAMGSQEIINRISAKTFGRHFIEDSIDEGAYTSEDVLSELKSNIAELEDVSQRLRFMMREVSYLVAPTK